MCASGDQWWDQGAYLDQREDPMTQHPPPPWRLIYDDLRRQIDAGDLQPGDQLPSTPHLQQQYAHLVPAGRLSVGPVRRAVHTLQAQGYLVTWPGLGVYVAER